MTTNRLGALTLTLLTLTTSPGQADWMPAPVSLSVSQLKNGLYRYDYTVTNTDNTYPANFFDPVLGKIVPYEGSFIFSIKLLGLLISPTGNNAEIMSFVNANPAADVLDPINGVISLHNGNLSHGDSYAFTLVSPNAPGTVHYEIQAGYVGLHGETAGSTSGDVLGPNVATPEPGTNALLGSGALFLLFSRRLRGSVSRLSVVRRRHRLRVVVPTEMAAPSC